MSGGTLESDRDIVERLREEIEKLRAEIVTLRNFLGAIRYNTDLALGPPKEQS